MKCLESRWAPCGYNIQPHPIKQQTQASKWLVARKEHRVWVVARMINSILVLMLPIIIALLSWANCLTSLLNLMCIKVWKSALLFVVIVKLK